MSKNNQGRQGGQGGGALQRRQQSDPWDSFFGPLMTPLMSPTFMRWDLSNQEGNFVPQLDIHEDDKTIMVDMEVAGVPKEDIQIECNDYVLTVSGEKKYEKKDEREGRVHRIERRYGSFRRSISLPETADLDSVQARFDNGVLKVVINKKPSPAPKKVNIQ